MRGILASNRLIISQLLTSFDRRPEGDKKERATDRPEMDPLLAAILRHVPRKALHFYLIVALCFAGIVAGNTSLFAGLMVLPVSVVFLYLYVSNRETKRRALIDRDIPALLTSVASSVRAGIDPIRAMCDAEQYFAPENPFAQELKGFKQRLRMGDDEFEVIEGFFAAEANRDVELFKRCIMLSRRHGSSLAEPIHRVVRVVRQRQSFRRKTKAALAMHRMSAIGIALCAVLITAMQVVTNLSGVKVALANPLGKLLLFAGGGLILLGVVWMLMMGKEEKL